MGSCWYVHAIGVGLPGVSIQAAGLRTLLSLIGMLWALLGIELQRFALSQRIQHPSQSESGASEQQQQPATSRLAALRSALMVGITSALGYTIGLVLGLPRDFWIIITIIVAVRPNGSLTITFTSMIIGTIAGALIAAVILHETTNRYLLLELTLYSRKYF